MCSIALSERYIILHARVGDGAHEIVARKIGSFSKTTRRSDLPRRRVETTIVESRRDAWKIAARARKNALDEQRREDLRWTREKCSGIG